MHHKDCFWKMVDSDANYKKRSKSNRGGTTTVYRKTIIGGNKITIGKNANITTVNIGNRTVSSQGERKPFTTKYDEQRAVNEERRLWEAMPKAAQNGCFVNLQEKHLVQEYVFNLQMRNDMSGSVGIIYGPGGNATCFRVGPNHIITPLHVLRGFIDHELQEVSENVGHASSSLFNLTGVQTSDSGTTTNGLSVLGKMYVVFSFINQKKMPSCEAHTCFKFKRLNSVVEVPFFDVETDCIVLELCYPENGVSIPQPFKQFSIPKFRQPFHLISHGGGRAKHIERVDVWIDPKEDVIKKDVEYVRCKSDEFLRKHSVDTDLFKFEPGDEYNTPLNEGRFLFHCIPEAGASGAPGVVVCDDGGVVVVTMLLCGYPDWYHASYDEKIQNIRAGWSKEYCVEQGVSIQRIYEKMRIRNPDLCKSIFECV